tara:strand:- start:275 stop:505 length:231 start_codon:yes stop_codon:yes gene_type:complete
MGNLPKRRIDIATSWASNRITVMDKLERYEDSYAIAEEFREWIVNIGGDDINLSKCVMNFPKNLNYLLDKKTEEKY